MSAQYSSVSPWFTLRPAAWHSGCSEIHIFYKYVYAYEVSICVRAYHCLIRGFKVTIHDTVTRVHTTSAISVLFKESLKKLFRSHLTCKEMRKFDGQYHGLFQSFLSAFQASDVAPLHVGPLYDNGTYREASSFSQRGCSSERGQQQDTTELKRCLMDLSGKVLCIKDSSRRGWQESGC